MKQIKITLEPDGSYTVTTVGFGLGPYYDHDRVERYGNGLYRGPYEVINHMGQVIQYPDGLHLVKSENGVIRTMTNEEYEKYTGRANTANEA